VTDLIYGPTEGNAFFVQELLRTLLERGEIHQDSSGRWEPREGADVAVPATVQAAVLERVSRLSASTQETLGVAGVLGQRFGFYDLLATCSRMPETSEALATTAGARSEIEAEARLEVVLDEAVRSRVLREVSSSGYAFSHALAQQALYEQLSFRRRQRVHRAVAESLEHLAEPERSRRVADVAYHFLQANEPASALPYLLLAGEQAQAVYAHSEAERQFRTALGLAHQLGETNVGSEAEQQLGQALLDQGRYAEASSVLEEAATGAEHRGDLTRLAHLIWLQSSADAQLGVGAGPEGKARLLRLIETTRAQGARPELVWLYHSLGAYSFASGQYADELEAAEHAFEVAQATGDAGLVVLAQQRRGQALGRMARFEEAASELATVLAVLQNLEQQHESVLPLSDLEIDTLGNLGNAVSTLGRLDEAHAYYERALAVAEQKRFSAWEADMAANCAWNAFDRGDWLAACRYTERAAILMGQMGTSSDRRPVVYIFDGFLQLAQGQLEAATQSAEVGLALAERRGGPMVWWVLQFLVEIDLERGDHTSARTRLSSFPDPATLTECDIDDLLQALVWVQLESGDVEAAEELATQSVARLRAKHLRSSLVHALRIEAAIWIRQERWDEAQTALEETLALARPMPYPYAEAKALTTYGDLLVARGQPAEAHDRYEAALAILRPLGEVPYTKRIERALLEMACH
jgi:tetratricopeptide (TPR) repeat protein